MQLLDGYYLVISQADDDYDDERFNIIIVFARKVTISLIAFGL